MKNFPFKIYNLSHEIRDASPHWFEKSSFKLETVFDYGDCNSKTKFRAQNVFLNTNLGTHIDSPAHCFKGALNVASLNLNEKIFKLYVFDFSHKNFTADYLISQKDLIEYQVKNAKLADFLDCEYPIFVIIYTGWGKFWTNPEKYRNNLLFPTLAKDAVSYLSGFDVAGLGVDTLSPDSDKTEYFAHATLLSKNWFFVENLVYCDNIKSGDYVLISPLQIADCVEAPVQVSVLSVSP